MIELRRVEVSRMQRKQESDLSGGDESLGSRLATIRSSTLKLDF